MADRNLVVVGAGPGLGWSIARRFGQEGFRTALIARNREKLDGLVGDLKRDGIEAAGFAADVTDEVQLAEAIAAAKAAFGAVDVLEYSPAEMPSDPRLLGALKVTPELALSYMKSNAIGAVAAVRQVLPEMIARASGTILVTTGLSAVTPVPFLAGASMGGAALRNYALNLNAALAGTGVFAATICLGVIIKKGDPISDPDRLAEAYYDLYLKRDRAEVTILAETDATAELQKRFAAA